jgi:crotonobetainyl-CoA:carnitine CoA-transferase CaiB-like acyl-CoA transferase
MGQPELLDDSRFATNPARMENNEVLQAKVIDWVASYSREEALGILEKFEVVSSAVNDSSDIVVDPHFLERTLVEVKGEELLKSVLMPGPILHMRESARPNYDGVPRIGQHTDALLGELIGESAESIAELRAAGVIGGND